MFSKLARTRDLATLMNEFRKEAKRRGVPVTDFVEACTPEEEEQMLLRAMRGPDVTRWGLPPRSALVAKPSTGVPAVDLAVDAAKAGDWRPAAAVLADSLGDWDLRTAAVRALGGVAANDDDWLAAWRAASRDDPHIAVVDAESIVYLAWSLRGSALAKDTTAEQALGFHRVLPRAEEAVARAAEGLPADPTPWDTLLTAARGLSYDHDRFAKVWREVMDRAPLHRGAHQSALQYWCAKWRGSTERMYAFAAEAAEKSPSLAVIMVQAAFEVDGWTRPDVQHALDVLVGWLDTDEANTVHLRDDLGWAAAALVDSGRAAEALPLFRRLGAYAGGSPWQNWDKPVVVFEQYRAKAAKASPRSA
jgi:hypothetical protein